ncbi:unnamed protein product [Cochlearia groenlandica]
MCISGTWSNGEINGSKRGAQGSLKKARKKNEAVQRPESPVQAVGEDELKHSRGCEFKRSLDHMIEAAGSSRSVLKMTNATLSIA